MSLQEAGKHLKIAREHLGRAATAWYDPPDHAECVTWAFYGYENAVVAAAEAASIPWQRTHPSKVQVARELHQKGIVKEDIGDKLEELNALRKDVQYDEPGPELMKVDLEDLVRDLEEYCDEVEEFIKSKEAPSADSPDR